MAPSQGMLWRLVATFAAMASGVLVPCAGAQTIVDEWAAVKAPPPPALKPVALDRKTTALLMLDFNQQSCNPQRRPRCVASIPRIKPLLAAARAAGMPVVFSVGGGGKPSDIAADLAPVGDEPVVSSGVDKFAGTDLEKILRAKGVTTVIVVGAAAHGAVLYTASGAAMRGMKVVVPVDGISAELPYAEQYTAWHLVNVPVLSPAFTLTTIDGLKF